MEHARKRRSARIAGVFAAALLFLAPLAAGADDHDPAESGHPIEVVASLLYPVGWVVDTLVLRPLHWLANHEPIATLTGHETEHESPHRDE